MQDRDRLWKTEAGREEMRSRALKLRPALRSTLLLRQLRDAIAKAKGQSTGAQWFASVSAAAGIPGSFTVG